jgi:hypothetical protein
MTRATPLHLPRACLSLPPPPLHSSAAHDIVCGLAALLRHSSV